MMLVLLYGACLLVSVLVSGVAARTVLSTTLALSRGPSSARAVWAWST